MRQIRIEAHSAIYSVSETIAEKHAVNKLKLIKKSYLWTRQRIIQNMMNELFDGNFANALKEFRLNDANKLKVTKSVVA